MRFLAGITVFLALVTGALVAGPVVPGLHGKHPLDEAGKGRVLVSELRCAACHEGIAGEMKSAPDLREAGSRLSGDYLRRYLANPHAVHPGTTMPDVLVGLSPDEKAKVSETLSHYLGSLVAPKKTEVVKGDLKRGHEIYHEVGCVACHSPRNADGKELKSSGVVSLAHVGGKYHEGELARFLMDPLAVRPSGRMPNMKLTTGDAAALEAYLGGGRKMIRDQATPEQIALGKANFEKYNCVSCHDMGESKPAPGPALKDLKLDAGCLTGKGVDYQLGENQVKEIKAALAKPVVLDRTAKIEAKLTQLNCIACHSRDAFGGVSNDLDEFFHTTEEALGDAARIPPPLTKVGGKLRPEWLGKVLYEGMSVRPYMKTRMPQYGRKALDGIGAFLAEEDKVPPVELPPPNRQERPM
ncbi:MAG: c-type cytochrome, partial [Akkermansiaceae bacterium]